MTKYVAFSSIKIAEPIYHLVNDEIAPETGIPAEGVWTLVEELVGSLGPENAQLLNKRNELQDQINDWFLQRRTDGFDLGEYRKFPD